MFDRDFFSSSYSVHCLLPLALPVQLHSVYLSYPASAFLSGRELIHTFGRVGAQNCIFGMPGKNESFFSVAHTEGIAQPAFPREAERAKDGYLAWCHFNCHV